MSKFEVDNKFVFIAGGSKGLGKELGKQLVAKGANIVILARTQSSLDEAKKEIELARKTNKQVVDTISVDLCESEKVDEALKNYGVLPNILICTAGGTSTQLGFLADINAREIKSCLESNYYSSVFITQSCLRLWLKTPSTSTRHIVFTSSTAAFVGLPGYVAYTPAKVAIRALADTLRQELLLYGDTDKYQVHCCFPGTFISDAFVQEQEIKPDLLKILEKTDAPLAELEKKCETAESAAKKVLVGLERGQYFITLDLDTKLLLNNMRGPSPRDSPITDYFLGCMMSFIWPFVRRDFDAKTRVYGRKTGMISNL